MSSIPVLKAGVLLSAMLAENLRTEKVYPDSPSKKVKSLVDPVKTG